MKVQKLRYRSPAADGVPPVGAIIMGQGPRVRRGYRVLRAVKAKSSPAALGVCTWRVSVESMSAEAARAEIAAGAPHWGIVWDRR